MQVGVSIALGAFAVFLELIYFFRSLWRHTPLNAATALVIAFDAYSIGIGILFVIAYFADSLRPIIFSNVFYVLAGGFATFFAASNSLGRTFAQAFPKAP